MCNFLLHIGKCIQDGAPGVLDRTWHRCESVGYNYSSNRGEFCRRM